MFLEDLVVTTKWLHLGRKIWMVAAIPLRLICSGRIIHTCMLFNVVVERNDDDSYDYYSHLIDFAEHICEALGKREKDVYVCVSVI